MQHQFHCTAKFSGGYHGQGTIDNRNLKTKISIPKEMDGPDVGTNPDELLLSAAITCFTITLSSFFHKNNIPIEINHVEGTATVSKTNQILDYESIVYEVHLIDSPDPADKKYDDKRLIRYTEQAEKNCMITRAVKGNVDIKIIKITRNEKIIFNQ